MDIYIVGCAAQSGNQTLAVLLNSEHGHDLAVYVINKATMTAQACQLAEQVVSETTPECLLRIMLNLQLRFAGSAASPCSTWWDPGGPRWAQSLVLDEATVPRSDSQDSGNRKSNQGI